MIFNLPLPNLLQLIPLESSIVFYVEDETKIEIYIPKNAVILKSVYMKIGENQDLIWKDDHLKTAMRIISVDEGNINFKIVRE